VVAPVILDEGAVPQVLHADAAQVEQIGGELGLRRPREEVRGRVDSLLQGSAEVGRTETAHMPDGAGPLVCPCIAVVTGTAYHQTAHRVPDEDDLVDDRRPGLDQLGHDVGETLPLLDTRRPVL
jgi:hypothetical protein